ncbi:DUF2787 family protein [Syntrophotalea acetylenica]|uniref:DUF2787 domain-containing protein n=1 Tax=Syntrophotalea acetylenica TaxID=29542 RepID=A0A1L3GE61_SYNAC|nr:DUF2787 family protein [Syntrophotalea acetylenica]APG24246.1 hypothetical protein A7E75_03745 [Syntrophotalea acetylenica]APG44827.1 hypothetical protein A6070_12370 [Syntrophotalea acetylenica]
MNLDAQSFPLPIDRKLEMILKTELAKVELPVNQGLTISFRDRTYDVIRGGYHPVEIALSSTGRVLYITDFVLVGQPPYVELVKELDFDACLGLFQQGGVDYPLEMGADLFALWQRNFCIYYRMSVYEVKIRPL